MIAIIDYGVGNLFSLQSSLKFIGADAEVTNDIAKIKAADRIILPAWVRLRMRFGSCVKAAWSRLFWRKRQTANPCLAFA